MDSELHILLQRQFYLITYPDLNPDPWSTALSYISTYTTHKPNTDITPHNSILSTAPTTSPNNSASLDLTIEPIIPVQRRALRPASNTDIQAFGTSAPVFMCRVSNAWPPMLRNQVPLLDVWLRLGRKSGVGWGVWVELMLEVTAAGIVVWSVVRAVIMA